MNYLFFFFNDTATTEIYTLSLHDALPIWIRSRLRAESASKSSRALRPKQPKIFSDSSDEVATTDALFARSHCASRFFLHRAGHAASRHHQCPATTHGASR